MAIQVYHCLKAHFGDANVQWQRISENDENKARLLAEKDTSYSRAADECWMCIYCRGSSNGGSIFTIDCMKSHCYSMCVILLILSNLF